MSLYSLFNTVNINYAAFISGIVGYKITEEFPRFRNAFSEDPEWNKPSTPDFLVYTRMGGGNRDCWDEGDSDTECQCVACICDRIEEQPECLGSYDDQFDCTYRTFGMKFTPEQKKFYDSLENSSEARDELLKRVSVMFDLHV